MLVSGEDAAFARGERMGLSPDFVFTLRKGGHHLDRVSSTAESTGAIVSREDLENLAMFGSALAGLQRSFNGIAATVAPAAVQEKIKENRAGGEGRKLSPF